jgi:hypothetical protein
VRKWLKSRNFLRRKFYGFLSRGFITGGVFFTLGRFQYERACRENISITCMQIP